MPEEVLTTAGGVRILITGDGSGFSAAVADANKQVAKLQGNVREMGTSTRKELGEAKGAAAVLGEELGVHLPRHVRNFIAEMPGVSKALSSAFNAVAIFAIGAAIIEAGRKIAEFVNRTRESAEKLKQAQESWGDAVQKTFRSYEQKLLQAGIETDELAGDHLGALRNQLKLIDMQGFDNLAGAFKQLETAAQNTFQTLKASWIDTVISFITTGQMAAGSSGVAASERRFGTDYNRLLGAGDAKGAQTLLGETESRESAVLFLMKSARDQKDPRGADAAGAVLKRDYGVSDVGDKAYEAEQQFMAELHALRVAIEKQTQLTAGQRQNAITKTDKELADELRKMLDANLKLLGSAGSASTSALAGLRTPGLRAQLKTDAEMQASPYIYMPSKGTEWMTNPGPTDFKGMMATFPKPDLNLSLTAIGQLRETVLQLESQFTNLGQILSTTVTHSLNQFNDVLAGMISGKHGESFAKMGQEITQTVSRGGLEYAEGAVLKSLGIGGKKGDSEGSPLWVRIAGTAAGIAAHGAGGAGSSFLHLLHIPGFAAGGSISSNMPAIVGENGPELFMPSSAGRIVPNNKAFGGTTVHVDARGSTDPAAVESSVHRAMRGYLAQIPDMAIQAVSDYNSRRPKSGRL